MREIFLGISIALLLFGCTAPEWSKEAAEKAGFKDVETGGDIGGI